MTQNLGNAGAYAGGTTHRPLPKADTALTRGTHTPARPKPTGLDWSKHTAPGTTPHASLDSDLAALELTDPTVRQAAARLDEAVDRVVHRDDYAHPEPPKEGKQGKPTTRSSAPRAASASSITGRAPVAGPSTTQEKNPPAAQETRPAAAGGLPDLVVEHCTTILNRTKHHPDPLVQQLRSLALSAIGALDLAYDPPTPLPPRTPDARPAPPPTPKARAPRPIAARRGPDLNAKEIAARYRAGESAPELARAYGVLPKRIRTILDTLGVPRRDDRTLKSGGRPREYDEHTVEQVRDLYLNERLSRTEVAHQLGLPLKTVVTIMARHDIQARKGMTGAQDGAKSLKQTMTDHGITSRQVKDWALTQGHITTIARGLPNASLVRGYLTAHQNGAVSA